MKSTKLRLLNLDEVKMQRPSLLLVLYTILLATTWRTVSAGCLNDQESDEIEQFSDTDRQNLYTSQQTFSVSLLSAIHHKYPSGNIFFSAYSTFNCLLLAYFPARKDTEAELKKALHLDWSKSKMQVLQASRYEKQVQAKRSENNTIVIDTADKLYVAKQIAVRECMKKYFSEELESKDFQANPEQCREEMNAWIEEKTRGMLPNAIPSGVVDQGTKLALVNTAFFKGNWVYQFDKNKTKTETFHLSPNKEGEVTMMSHRGAFRYANNEELGAEILQLPYQGADGQISMIIFLPPLEENGIEKLLSKITPKNLQEALDSGNVVNVNVKLPKFSLTMESDLVPILQSIGAGGIFEPKADLTGLANTSFDLGKAFHKAKIEVYEEGSKAAAVTVMITFRSGSYKPPEPKDFFCDRPFLYMIYDSSSKAVLFTGILREPVME